MPENVGGEKERELRRVTECLRKRERDVASGRDRGVGKCEEGARKRGRELWSTRECVKERTGRKKRREVQGEKERYIEKEVDFGCERSTRTQ